MSADTRISFEPLSKVYSISAEQFKRRNILNPTFNTDVGLFIDPTLLKNSNYKIFSEDARIAYEKFFINLYNEISAIGQLPQNLRNKAKVTLINKLKSQEQVGLCLGFSKYNTNGRGIGKEIALQLINSAYQLIVESGSLQNVHVFSILFLLERGIGPDFISDMTAQIIKHQLAEFTEVNAKEMGIETHTYKIDGKKYELPKHPLNKNYILLVPYDILSKLPMEDDFDTVLDGFINIANSNEGIKTRVNQDIANIFKEAQLLKMKEKEIKDEVKNYVYKNPQAISELGQYMSSIEGKPYGFLFDNMGITIPAELLEREDLNLIKIDSKKRKLDIIDDLINQFQQYVENNNELKRSLLWHTDFQCVEECGWQNLFNTFVNQVLKNCNIDITPESETGVGPVDFKFSEGENFKVLVEIKLSTNTKYAHGYEKQLEKYKQATTNVVGAYFIFIDANLDEKKIEKQQRKLIEIKNKAEISSKLIFIDGKIHPSASKI